MERNMERNNGLVPDLVTGDRELTGLTGGMRLLRKCSLHFCDRISVNPSMTAYPCERHLGVKESGVEWAILLDPNSGDDGYIYSGVEYRVTAWSQRVRVKFIGIFAPSSLDSKNQFTFSTSCPSTHTPSNVWSMTLTVAFDAISDIEAT
jgi:hypothetical protein